LLVQPSKALLLALQLICSDFLCPGHHGLFIVLLLWLLQKFSDLTSARRPTKAFELNSDEDDYETMKFDSEENKDEYPDVGADEQENNYDSGKEKAGKMSSKVKESSGRKKTDRGSGHKTGTPRTISKCLIRKSSSKISKEQESPDGNTKVFSRKRKPSSKGTFVEKDTKEMKSSGKRVWRLKFQFMLRLFCLAISWSNHPYI
jgi:protein DEK